MKVALSSAPDKNLSAGTRTRKEHFLQQPWNRCNMGGQRSYFAHPETVYFGSEVSMKTKKCVGLALLALGVAFTSGCERHSNKEVFYLISSNMALPYWQNAAKGFNQAAALY